MPIAINAVSIEMEKKLKYFLSYDPETGVFKWANSPNYNIKSGDTARNITVKGYARIRLNKKHFFLHRVAWFFYYGSWPDCLIDHINGDRADNRISNLREASFSENARSKGIQKNNKTGYKGISKVKGCYSRFSARIVLPSGLKYIGSYKSEEEAHAAYIAEAQKHFGEFWRKA